MKVILKADVPEVGKKMQVIDVKSGYATNFLFKKNLAVPATDENMEALKQELADIAKREAELKQAAEDIKKIINGKTYTMKLKCGKGEKLYGALTNQEVADFINKTSNVEIDKRKVVCENIKTLGEHEIKVKLHPQVEALVTLKVEALAQ
jgi:large subunit ribosomal protein L9